MVTYSSNLSRTPQALLDVCDGAGLIQRTGERTLSASLVLFEAGEAATASLDAQSAPELIENLRTGGRLLFTLSPYAGKSALWLSSVLPSTGWTTQLRPTPFTYKDPISISGIDRNFFLGLDIEGLRVPPAFDIRPTSAAERGQSRYERYRLRHGILKTEVPAASDLWSRPLLNREWTVRARYDDLASLPLLVTGRYGAGRVAMLATNAIAVGESAQAKAFWRAVLGWLLEVDKAAAISSAPVRPTLVTSFPTSNVARLTLAHPSTVAVQVQLVLRMMDADGAMLPDGDGETQRQLTLQPGRPTILDLPLPSTLAKSLELDRVFQVRAGLLSADGSTLLVEQRTLSSPSPISLRVETDNLYSKDCPFHSPGPRAIAGFQGRMGIYTGAYGYRPGTVLKGTAFLSFQIDNLSPLARIRDLTQPDNASVMALNDRSAGLRQVPGADKIEAYGTWNGKHGVENVLQFTLPVPSRITAVTLVGSFGPFAYAELHNPGRAVIELDGRAIETVPDLDSAFASGYGQAKISFAPTIAGTVTVRLPWVEVHGPTSRARAEPWLGEVILEGWPADTAATSSLSGRFAVDVVDALTGERLSVLSVETRLDPCESLRQPFTVTLPDRTHPGILRLEAAFESASGARMSRLVSAPILLISPKTTLKPFADLSPPGVFGTALVVTNGFTKFFPLSTGTSERWDGWAHPDDLVWAYSRQLKEIPPKSRTAGNRLYASETDMRHFSTPWREFPNGELFFPTAVSGLVNYLRTLPGWKAAPLIQMTFADRWAIGPELASCNSWQEFVAFDFHLRQTSNQGLFGSTHAEVEASIHATFENEWQAWQLERYVRSVRSVRDAFRAVGKEMFIYSQGFPLVAGEVGRELAQTIRGMNDDFTWGMQDNSPMLTTGRNLGEVAFNPVWQISTMIPWGFVSPVFNNWQWHTPVGTTEPSRRLIYNRIWRGMIWTGGRYGAVPTYGYTTNVGTPYTVTQEEYQQWWYLQERGSLLQPEAPIGAGLVISTQKNIGPEATRFNCNDSTSMPEPRALMQAFRSLSEAGLSLPFAANASTLRDWVATPGTSLIVLNLQDFSEAEISHLARHQEKGVRMAAFAEPASLAPSAKALFSRQNTLLIERYSAELSHAQAVDIATQLISCLQVPLRFSAGTAGYGFHCQNTSFIVVEDWLEQARMVTVHLRKSSGAQRAMASAMNDHSTLMVVDGGESWEISLPLCSADGALIAVREV